MKRIQAWRWLPAALLLTLAVTRAEEFAIQSVDETGQLTFNTLGEAVGAHELRWTTGGDAEWTFEADVPDNGGVAATSGVLTNNRSSWLQALVTGPGLLSFRWAALSEVPCEPLAFHIDDVEQTRITARPAAGPIVFEPIFLSIPDGSHLLNWIHADEDSAAGSSQSWVNQVTWTPFFVEKVAQDAIADDTSVPSSLDPGALSAIVVLPAPTGVWASDGKYTDRVTVSWNAVPGASHYRVWRAESAAGAKVPLGGWRVERFYQNYSAVPSRTYYYFVQAARDAAGSQTSAFSAYNTGWRKLQTPTGVWASDAKYTDRVTVSWNAVPGASHYRVWRAESAAGAKVPLGGWRVARFYQNYSAVPGRTYYYFVQAARDASGWRPSNISPYDTGWRKQLSAGDDGYGIGTFSATGVVPDIGFYSFNQEGEFAVVSDSATGRRSIRFSRDGYRVDIIPIQNGAFFMEHGEINGTDCPTDGYAISGHFVTTTVAEGRVAYATDCRVTSRQDFTAHR